MWLRQNKPKNLLLFRPLLVILIFFSRSWQITLCWMQSQIIGLRQRQTVRYLIHLASNKWFTSSAYTVLIVCFCWLRTFSCLLFMIFLFKSFFLQIILTKRKLVHSFWLIFEKQKSDSPKFSNQLSSAYLILSLTGLPAWLWSLSGRVFCLFETYNRVGHIIGDQFSVIWIFTLQVQLLL